MAQNLFATLTSPSLVNLDANFTQLYDLRELISTPGYTAAVPRVTIDGNGVFMVNGNSAYAGAYVHQMVLAYSGGGTTFGMGFRPTANNANAVTFANAANSVVGSIYTTSSATAYNTTSDARLKCNISPALPAGQLLDDIAVVQHHWLAGGAHVRHGFIAQALAEVYPEAVTPGDDDELVSRPWAVDNSKLVPLLVQELQALRRRVALLEAAA